MFGIGSQELIIIFGIVFLIFGAKRLPEMGKGLGQAIRGFRGAIQEKPQIEKALEMENPKNQSLTPK
jgi:sec-independent protein translocase protein TatA